MERQRKKFRVAYLQNLLTVVIRNIEQYASYITIAKPFALYWRAMAELSRHDVAKARVLFTECIAESEDNDKCGKYDCILAKLKLIELGGTTPTSDILSKVGKAADLHTLATLGERGNDEAIALYGEILDEPDFVDLFTDDNHAGSETESNRGSSQQKDSVSIFERIETQDQFSWV